MIRDKFPFPKICAARLITVQHGGKECCLVMAFSFSILLLSRTVLALVPLFLVFRGILVPPRGYLTSSGCFHPFAKE